MCFIYAAEIVVVRKAYGIGYVGYGHISALEQLTRFFKTDVPYVVANSRFAVIAEYLIEACAADVKVLAH
jgi:hypothetical protein